MKTPRSLALFALILTACSQAPAQQPQQHQAAPSKVDTLVYRGVVDTIIYNVSLRTTVLFHDGRFLVFNGMPLTSIEKGLEYRFTVETVPTSIAPLRLVRTSKVTARRVPA